MNLGEKLLPISGATNIGILTEENNPARKCNHKIKFYFNW